MVFMISSLRKRLVRPKSWPFTLSLEKNEIEFTDGKSASKLPRRTLISVFVEKNNVESECSNSQVSFSLIEKVSKAKAWTPKSAKRIRKAISDFFTSSL